MSITICEVKTREEKFKHYNAALESVDARKIQTLVDLSYAFLHSISYGKGIKKPALRIAVAEVYYKEFLWIKRCTSISIKYLNNYVF